MTEEQKNKASTGVRKDYMGRVLGNYAMRQDNARTKSIAPKETPDLTDKQKDDLLTESTYNKVGEPYVKTIQSRPIIDNVRTEHADKTGFHHTRKRGTADMKQDYEHPVTGEKKTIKTGELGVDDWYFHKEPKKGNQGYAATDLTYVNGKNADKKDGKPGFVNGSNGFKHTIDLDDNERVKFKPVKGN